MENAWWWILGSWQRKHFVLKTHFWGKILYFLKKCPKLFCVWLIQAPNMSKHISRNRGAIIKASRKTAHDKVFIFWGKKPISPKKWWHYQKKVIALNLYIGTNVLVYERWLVLKVWYTVGLPAMLLLLHRLSNCLCMWVKHDLFSEIPFSKVNSIF